MFKKFIRIIALVLMSVMCFSVAACTSMGDQSKMIARLEITKTGKQIFEHGEEFSSAGLEVKKVMGDSKESVLTLADYEVDSSAFDKNKAGTYPIFVKHENSRAKYSVMVVGLKMVELEVSGQTTIFPYGNDFSAKSLVAMKVMSDGSKIALNEGEYSIDSSNYNSEKPGEYDITVSYRSKSFKYTVTVKDFDVNATLSGLEIVKQGKTYFEIGEPFAAGAIELKRVMSDGSKFKIADGAFTIDSSKYNSAVKGTYAISISFTYNGVSQSVSYDVVVADVAEIEITKPGTTVFYLGEDFAVGEIEVSRVMSNGSKVALNSSEYTVDSSNYDKTKAGTYTIKINFKNLSVTYSVVVEAEYKPTPGKDVIRPITDTFKDSSSKRTYTFEAEYISFKGLVGSGHSGSAKEEGMIQDSVATASNKYIVGFMHGADTTLEFKIYNNSAKNVKFDFWACLYSEIGSVDFGPDAMEIALNGKAFPYVPLSLDGVGGNDYGKSNYVNVIPTEGELVLIPGWNSITFTTLENDLKGGVTGGAAFDYIDIAVDKTVDLQWMPLWGNIGRR